MVHGRMIRPPVAGASAGARSTRARSRTSRASRSCTRRTSSASSPTTSGTPSRRRKLLKVEWSQPQPPFLDNAGTLYDHIRKAPVRKREVEKENGNVDEAFKTAARVIEAEYEWPFQSHSSMGPACGVVEIKGDQVTVLDRLAEAALLPRRRGRDPRPAARQGRGPLHGGPRHLWPQRCRRFAAWTPPCWRRAVGQPVRVQYMRADGTGWDPKGPASIHRARAAIDASGKVIAYEFTSKGFSRVDVNTNESKPWDTLAGHLLGVPLKSGDGFGVPAESYEFDNKRVCLGDDRAAARPRLAAAHLASARSGRAADPLRERILHRRGGGGAQRSIRSSSACATSRMRATPR